MVKGKLHACFEALRNITICHPNLIPGHLILCIDNSSAIGALDDPSTEHQHAVRKYADSIGMCEEEVNRV
jgi:hypothetical protein